ncbi:MAG: hypothetical protein JST12_18340 [Armatimonadetes bacterium]|nr:hypothetical protein [Armatimonadota bacterium]
MISSVVSFVLMAQSQTGPLTKAEATNYQETSSYADVMKFLQDLKATGAPIDLRYSGTSTEGKKIPMVIAARPMVKGPKEAAKSGKLIIYVQANIHAGEVEGKEAAMMLLRDYCRQKKGVLDKAILIVQPIYNIDGNEKFGPQERNRPGQNGPEMIGVRYNGQNLDLNRDCMKVESPEMEGVLKHIYTWHPHAMFDLHTTDGTRHGYQLTYAGPLNPNTHPALAKYELDEFLPAIRKNMKKDYGKDIFDYGNGINEGGKWRFETFGGEPRYVTNYGALRNTLTILSESVVYETFKDRVLDTEHFVDECMQKLLKDEKRVKAMQKRADAAIVNWGKNPTKAPQMAIRYKMKLRGNEPVLLEKGLADGGRRSGPVRDIETVPMDVDDRFEGEKFAKYPFAFIVPSDATKAIEKLKLHGVKMQEIADAPQTIPAEEFHIEKFNQARNAFQGHKLITLDGEWSPVAHKVSGYFVPMAQPLGLLAFELLEPDAVDGLTAWGFFGDTFEENSTHPVLRVSLPIKVNLKGN